MLALVVDPRQEPVTRGHSVEWQARNRTAKFLPASTPTIQAWLEQFAAAYTHKPELEG